MNVISIIGRVGKDPESRTTSTGTEYATFSVAVKRRGAQDKTDWFAIKAWGKTAAVCLQYVAKGRQVAITGSVQIDEWEGQDGTRRTTVTVSANDVQLLDRRDDQGGGQRDQERFDHRTQRPAAAPKPKRAEPSWQADDDIPLF